MRRSTLQLTSLILWTAVVLVPGPALADSGPARKAVVRSLARFGVSPGTIPPTTRSYIRRMDNMQPKNGPVAPVSTSRYGFNVTKSGHVSAGSGKTKPITRDVHFLINEGRILSTTRTTHTNTHYWRSDNPGQYLIDYTLKPNHRSGFVRMAKQYGIGVAQGDTVRTQVNIDNGKWASTSYLLNDRGVLFVSAKKPSSVPAGWLVKQLPTSGKHKRWARFRAPSQP